jgi:hypothetical protein
MEMERQNRILTLCLTFALLVCLAQGCAALKRAEPAARSMLEHGDEICITLQDDEQELCGDAVELARLLVEIADKHAELAAARRSSLDDEHPVTIESEGMGTSGSPSQ